MRKLFLLLFLILASSTWVYGENIFDSVYYDSTGYGALQLKFLEFDDEPKLMVGGKGAWILNRQFIVGAAGYGLATEHYEDEFHMGYGGLLLGYVTAPDAPIHLNFEALFGMGGASYRRVDSTYFDDYEDRSFYVFEPGISLEFNLYEYFRIETGLSYLFINDLKQPSSRTYKNYSEEDIEGWTGNISFKLGLF
jgi:hypothetical protein